MPNLSLTQSTRKILRETAGLRMTKSLTISQYTADYIAEIIVGDIAGGIFFEGFEVHVAMFVDEVSDLVDFGAGDEILYA